ncbi:hypothetical protein FGO68_gene3796 [Halteria grandinella]|uniref:Uncharacterized protein n=1 Tax=Halteria grandinella TaxID=5974 RepID=A0A8J8NWA3_HALGN|nr:hypothetical protein FGO68_gene3796 [Halteria grandinella]
MQTSPRVQLPTGLFSGGGASSPQLDHHNSFCNAVLSWWLSRERSSKLNCLHFTGKEAQHSLCDMQACPLLNSSI